MDLVDFANANMDSNNGVFLPRSGVFTERLFRLVRDEGKTASLIATHFWRAFLASESLRRTERDLDLPPGRLFYSEKLVVYRAASNRYDLIALFPSLPAMKGTGTTTRLVTPTEDELLEGWYTWNRRGLASASPYNNPNLAIEALRMGQPFAILVAEAPGVEFTHAPAHWCKVDGSGVSDSSAGVVGKDKAGRQGVTAALHSIGHAKAARVDGRSGNVLATHQLSDSCFIELGNLPTVGNKGSKGPLAGILPRGAQNASFDGFNSRHVDTTINGWSPELPDVQTYDRLKVYTKKDTDPGDSGTALITDDDYIAGFAFQRSKIAGAGELDRQERLRRKSPHRGTLRQSCFFHRGGSSAGWGGHSAWP